MTIQLDLLTSKPVAPVCDPRVPEEAKPRLTRQEQAIVARLETGPASNRELADIALKYTSRISSCRRAGYRIEVIEQDHRTGFARYALVKGE